MIGVKLASGAFTNDADKQFSTGMYNHGGSKEKEKQL